jgi:serine/threonine protein kinase
MMESSRKESSDDKEIKEKKFKVQQTNGTNVMESLTYTAIQKLGSGSFGVVYQAKCTETGEIVAIKKVLQDSRYKNRELQILKELDHPNVIKIKQHFYHPSESDDLYLNVVMEYIPETLSNIIKHNYKFKKEMPVIIVKLYAYQMLKAINYIHSIGICHRDIKPQNILIDTSTHVLKLCDFGSAKKLVKGDTNVSYICSRYYRAPELIFSAEEYTNTIDIWSIGCVIAELVLSEPLFMGESSVDQLVEIIKVLGTPSKKQIKEMNPDYKEYKFPIIKCYTWQEIFKNSPRIPKDFFNLLSKILVYEPNKRIKPLEALSHSFFDELRDPKIMINQNLALPEENLFYFSTEELMVDKEKYIQKLIPEWYKIKTSQGQVVTGI